MWKKIIACLVIVVFLVTETAIPGVEAAEDCKGDECEAQFQGFLSVMAVVIVVAAVVTGVTLFAVLHHRKQKRHKKTPLEQQKPKETPEEQKDITPKEETTSYPGLDIKIDTQDVIDNDYASFSNTEDLPVEGSGAGVVVLKW